MSTRRLSILSILVFAIVASFTVPSFAGESLLRRQGGAPHVQRHRDSRMWEDSKSYRTTFAGGVVLNYAFNDAFSLEPELLYFSKGFVGNLYEGIVDVDVTASFDYMELPVLAKYTFLPGRKFRPCVFAGPSFIYSIASELEISIGTVRRERRHFQPDPHDRFRRHPGRGLRLRNRPGDAHLRGPLSARIHERRHDRRFPDQRLHADDNGRRLQELRIRFPRGVPALGGGRGAG